MNALEKRLRILPKENFNEAMDYFTEYFEDAGPEREQQAIQDLGSPCYRGRTDNYQYGHS